MKLDINTQLIDMDVLISEQIVRNRDDSYTIFLNSRLNHERQMAAYLHAINHIQNGDFEKESATLIEKRRMNKFFSAFVPSKSHKEE